MRRACPVSPPRTSSPGSQRKRVQLCEGSRQGRPRHASSHATGDRQSHSAGVLKGSAGVRPGGHICCGEKDPAPPPGSCPHRMCLGFTGIRGPKQGTLRAHPGPPGTPRPRPRPGCVPGHLAGTICARQGLTSVGTVTGQRSRMEHPSGQRTAGHPPGPQTSLTSCPAPKISELFISISCDPGV